MDHSGDGVLDRQELLRALDTYHIQVPEEVLVYKLHQSVTLLLLMFPGDASMRALGTFTVCIRLFIGFSFTIKQRNE